MNNITHDQAPLAGLQIPPFVPSQSQKRQLEKVAGKIKTLDAQMKKASDLKAYRTELQHLLATGEADLHDVGPMLYLIESASTRNDMMVKLRAPIKQAVKASLGELREILEAERQHQVEYVAKLEAKIEKAERSSLKAAGVGQDLFQPSPTLASLRESHRRLRELPLNIDRSALTRLMRADATEQ